MHPYFSIVITFENQAVVSWMDLDTRHFKGHWVAPYRGFANTNIDRLWRKYVRDESHSTFVIMKIIPHLCLCVNQRLYILNYYLCLISSLQGAFSMVKTINKFKLSHFIFKAKTVLPCSTFWTSSHYSQSQFFISPVLATWMLYSFSFCYHSFP